MNKITKSSLQTKQSCTIARFACGDWKIKRSKLVCNKKKSSQIVLIGFIFLRLRNSKVLISGLNGLGAEIAKNIILSGVKSVTFLDSKKVTKLDFASQFLIPSTGEGKFRADASLARAKALNPMVELIADTGNLHDKDEEFFKKFDVLVITEASLDEQIRIDNISRTNSIKFFAADMWGMFGFSFADLQDHEFAE